MFPNVRLMIGALLASVVVLCCGFGIFAAFRVNHEPLSRLPANTAALQLVAHEVAGSPSAWGAPVVTGSVRELPIDAETANAPRPILVRTDAIDASDSWATGVVETKAASDTVAPRQSPAASQPPSAMIAPSTPRLRPMATAFGVDKPLTTSAPRAILLVSTAPVAETANPTEPASASTAIATVARSTVPGSIAPRSSASLAVSAMPQASSAESQSRAADASQGAQDTTNVRPAPAVPEVAAIEPLPKPDPRTMQPMHNARTKVAALETKIIRRLAREPSRRTPRKIVRKPAERRRIVRRTIARPTTTAAAGLFGDTDAAPVFLSAPDALQRQPASNGRSVRRTNPHADANHFGGGAVGWTNTQ